RKSKIANSALRSHALFEGARGDGEAEVVTHEGDPVRAGGVEIAKRALRLDDERGGLGARDLAVTLWVTDVDQHLHVAGKVQIAAGQVGELHGAIRPARGHLAQREARANDEVLHMTRINALADFAEARLPIFAFPAVRR